MFIHLKGQSRGTVSNRPDPVNTFKYTVLRCFSFSAWLKESALYHPDSQSRQPQMYALSAHRHRFCLSGSIDHRSGLFVPQSVRHKVTTGTDKTSPRLAFWKPNPPAAPQVLIGLVENLAACPRCGPPSPHPPWKREHSDLCDMFCRTIVLISLFLLSLKHFFTVVTVNTWNSFNLCVGGDLSSLGWLPGSCQGEGAMGIRSPQVGEQ